ncbi:MAG: hypothetical protein JXO44_07560 [Clostridia bacterium]|nr:hypothetical protein [Clostridia bacterium]
MTHVDWIHFRKSVRKYKKNNIEPKVQEALKAQFEKVEPIAAHAAYDIHLVEDGRQMKQALEGLASRYMLVKAPHYLVLTCRNDATDIFNLGYIGEQLVKYLTLQNLGTCWIGARLSQEKLREMFPVDESHDFSIVIAFGEPVAPLEFIRNRKRKGIEEVFYGFNTLSDTDKFIAESLLTAPSAMNNQPWRFYFNGGVWDYYKTLPKGIFSKALRDLVNVDTGIALYHVIETAHSLGSAIQFEVMDLHKGDQNYMGTLKICD